MANHIPEWKMEKAVGLFRNGLSLRIVAKEVGIAKETAHRIQKTVKNAQVAMDGCVRVNTGKRASGEPSFYMTGETMPSWGVQRVRPPGCGRKTLAEEIVRCKGVIEQEIAEIQGKLDKLYIKRDACSRVLAMLGEPSRSKA